MGSLVLALLASAPSCAADGVGYCTDKVVRAKIAYAGDGPSVKINCALGDVVSIAFPPGVELRGEPALGNQAIFEFKAQQDPFRILVWPKYPANARDLSPDALLGERSNLQVFLDSGVTVVIELKIGITAKSVQQLRFEFPEREKESQFLREKMDAFARKLEDEYQERAKALDTSVEERARRRVARAMLQRVQCASLSARAMVDLLVVRAHKICRLGDLVFVELSIKNRARDLFHLGGVHISAAGGEEGEAEIEALTEYSGETTLGFDQEVRGVCAFTVSENIPKAYAVTVQESGGKKRAVTVNGVEF